MHILKVILHMATIVATLLLGIILLPSFDNQDLIQSTLNTKKLAIILSIGAYILAISVVSKIKSESGLRTASTFGVLLILGTIIIMFIYYFPFLNTKIVHVANECGGNFIRGDSVNFERLNRNTNINYDSFSIKDPGGFVQQCNCNPTNAWTVKSIEKNYRNIAFFFCGLLTLSAFGICMCIQAAGRFIILDKSTKNKTSRIKSK